jgi:hypothetical protein
MAFCKEQRWLQELARSRREIGGPLLLAVKQFFVTIRLLSFAFPP